MNEQPLETLPGRALLTRRHLWRAMAGGFVLASALVFPGTVDAVAARKRRRKRKRARITLTRKDDAPGRIEWELIVGQGRG